MQHELLPCPFCGGEAELDTAQSYRALSSGSLGSRAVVYCTRCGADMGFCYEDAPGTPREDIVNQVVDDWNRRATSPLPSSSETEWRPTHRHVKSGGEYMLLGIGRMQAENWHEHDGRVEQDPSVDMHEVVIYRSVDDGSLWVRPRDEFEDGRFVALSPEKGEA